MAVAHSCRYKSVKAGDAQKGAWQQSRTTLWRDGECRGRPPIEGAREGNKKAG